MKNTTSSKKHEIKRRAGRPAASFIGLSKNRPVPTDPIDATGARIRLLREQLVLSRASFGKQFGINEISLKNYENGYRAVDFDAVRNICEGFKADVQNAVIAFIALGKSVDPAAVPKVSPADLSTTPVEPRTEGYTGIRNEGDIALSKLLREVRTDFFGLSRPKFVELLKSDFPITTVKNYERMARRASYAYVRELVEHARNPLEAWKTVIAVSRGQPIKLAAWFSTRT